MGHHWKRSVFIPIPKKSENEVAQSCPTLVTLWPVAYQASRSMGFSRQEYWRRKYLSAELEPHPLS